MTLITALVLNAGPARSASEIQPITSGTVTSSKPTSRCSAGTCDVPPAQTNAVTSAMAEYRHDMPKVTRFGLLIESTGQTIEVTVYPAYEGDVPPFSVPGDHMAVTYIFDTSGQRQIRKYYNR
ncbi:MAG TPA: hypothetical protein VGN46_03675 [Luteibacter sp.]|uniref:hypothetical protein n=1 Tax=Luteibacter sp. TaxID=1886636 RepID=UPI002F3E2563